MWDSGPHLRTARGRRRTWRAAEQARNDDRVEETQSLAEEPEGDKWRKRKGEKQTRQRNASTLHLVIHLHATAAARSRSGDRSNAAAMTAKHRKTIVGNTTAGALKLKELVIENDLLFLVINVYDHATEFDSVYGCRRRHHVRDCCADWWEVRARVQLRECGQELRFRSL